MSEEAPGGGRRCISGLTPSRFSRLSQCLWPKGERHDVWMILDGSRDIRVFETLLESAFISSCLYSGFIPRALEASAPYLVQLEYEDRHTRRLLQHAWGNGWGVLLRCDTRIEALRRHLRQFLTVRDPKGQRLIFRYYDPRVLRVYLPTCTGEELRNFFGPVEQFYIEGERPEDLIEFCLNGSKLARSSRSLDESEPMRPATGAALEPQSTFRRPPGLFAIRGEQMAVFSTAAEQQFEDWMVGHLNRFFAARCKKLREEQLRELIRYGIRRAASHGLTVRRDVCKYIDVTMVLGRDFDQDSRYPWAAKILALAGQTGKGQALINAVRAHLIARI